LRKYLEFVCGLRQAGFVPLFEQSANQMRKRRKEFTGIITKRVN